MPYSNPDRLDEYILHVITAVSCAKHKSDIDHPCFIIMADKSDKLIFGICDSRARRAGLNGQVSREAYDRSYRRMVQHGKRS